jgi:O-antigen ligase
MAGLAGLAFRVAAPELIYGFWRPEAIAAKPLGPFVNRNHFAGWLLLILPLSIGYFVAQISSRLHHGRLGSTLSVAMRSRATTTGAAAFAMLIVLLLTGSRSAWVGLAASASVGWWQSRRRGSQATIIRIGTMTLGIVAVLLALLLVNPDRIFARMAASFEDLPASRLVIWHETLPLVGDFWGAGTGAGTFGMAMVGYQQTWAYFPHLREFMHFNQAHNHYLHVAAEGGMLIVVPMLAAIVMAGRSLGRALRDDGGETYWIRLGAGASLLGIAVQSAFEIPLIAPANAVLAAVVLAIGVHRRVPHRGATTRRDSQT